MFRLNRFSAVTDTDTAITSITAELKHAAPPAAQPSIHIPIISPNAAEAPTGANIEYAASSGTSASGAACLTLISNESV